MGNIKPKRFGLRVATVFACGSLLLACTGEPPKPASVVDMNASPAAVGEIGMPETPIVAAPLPRRGRVMGHQASQPTHGREIRSSKHVASAKERHRAVKARHKKATKHAVAHKANTRKQTKVTGMTKTPHSKT